MNLNPGGGLMDPVYIVTGVRTPLSLETVLAQTAWLRGLVRSLVTQRDHAEDVVQEAHLVALQREGNAVHSWLAQVTLDIVGRAHNRERVKRVVGPAAAGVVAAMEMQQRVTSAVLALEEPYRTAILLRFRSGLAYVEIARCTGVPLETVRTRVKRGLKQVRNLLDVVHGGCRGWAMPILGLAEWQRLVPVEGVGAVAVGSVVVGGIMGKTLLAAITIVLACCLWAFWPAAPEIQIGTEATAGSVAPASVAEPITITAPLEGAREEVSRTSEKILATRPKD